MVSSTRIAKKRLYQRMVYIIGSGPAGVSCAYALLKQGIPVTMLDAGIELETERQEWLRQIQRLPEHEWNNSVLQTLKENVQVDTKGIPLRLAYGSDFPYRDIHQYIPMQAERIGILPSLAKGGLGNVWGGAVLPCRDADIRDWPIKISDLSAHYEAVFSFMDLAAVRDDLGTLFPLYSDRYRSLLPSRQAIALMADLRKHTDSLKAHHVRFGYSRLAVRSYATSKQSGCVYCGCCLYGCPHELIYNAASTLTELQKHPDFTYIKDVVVERIGESGGTVKIYGKSRRDQGVLEFNGSRVYLACGTLPTTKILLESMEAYDQVLTAKDSQYFLLPLLRYRQVSRVMEERLHTLSQVFIEILDQELSEHTIHLQLYTYNDLYVRALKDKFRHLPSLFTWPISALVGRLFMIQGYLHSDLSSTVSIFLGRGRNGGPSRLYLRNYENPQTLKTLRALSDKLSANRRYFRFVPVFQMLQMGEFGRGFHSGGTFPMKHRPAHFECDVLGRPYGFERVHVVDATVFPSIPATTITLTVMANAYRIGSAFNET